MKWKRMVNYLRYPLVAAVAVFVLAAAEHRGVVKFGEVPVPGATVTATQGDKKVLAVTGQDGTYVFPELADGVWNIQVEMLCFAPLKKEIGISQGAPPAVWALTMLPMDQIKPETPAAIAPPTGTAPATAAAPGAASGAAPTGAAPAAAAPAPAATTTAANNKNSKNSKKGTAATAAASQPGFQRANVNATADAPADTGAAPLASAASSDAPGGTSDALLVNGSVSTGIERRAIGNFRVGPGSLYNAQLGFIVENSALDAAPYSITGQQTPKSLNRLQPSINFGGPLAIPHLFRYNGNFFIGYSSTRNRTSTTSTGLMPTAAERNGDFSQVLNPLGLPVTVYDPTTGIPFPNNRIPGNQISQQAKALLAYYPAPNNLGNTRFNYQIPLVSRQDSDSGQIFVNKNINNKNFLSVRFNISNNRGLNPNLFTFVDTSESTGLNTTANWRHNFNRQWNGNFIVNFSRSVAQATPFFAFKPDGNVSGKAGITGNDQSPNNYGPPNLNFNSGTQGLSDGNESAQRNQTASATASLTLFRRPHSVTMGGDFRLIENNPVSQQNARGSFGFTGAATQQIVNGVAVPGTGSDFADFLLGIPDTSNIAFGNADKYYRGTSSDLFIDDDWKVSSTLTLHPGLRWEYNSPITERYGRLVNLDLGPGFANPTPVVAKSPVGTTTGQHYPDSLVHPDKRAIQPRVSFAWHPFFGTSTIFKGSYGIWYDTSIYTGLVAQMAQQSPLSKSLSVANSPVNPLTLANGFNAAPNLTPNTFALDPNFRPGYAQQWQFSVQQNVTASMVLTATYNGTKGTHSVQEFLPNTYPAGIVNPCPVCLSGYTYVASNGDSTREAGQLNIRRRFHGGFSTAFQYVYSKSMDDAAFLGGGGGGGGVAQDWLHLNRERSLSSFDQRHVLTVDMQYSTGNGLRGGTLLSGWRGAIIKGWTIVSRITLGSGTPQTPIYPVAVGTTGSSGSTRPDVVLGQSLYDTTNGAHYNLAAFTAPPNGEWGDAGRNILIGPTKFNITASMQRSFEKFDLTINSTNPLNHVTYPGWGTNITSNQFGLPSSANAMRSITASLRWRFP
jgi:trimeric autotransporter adhesin